MAVSPFSFVLLACVGVSLADPLCTEQDVAEEMTKKLTRANNELAINMYRQLASNSSENIFFSPLSLSTAFGMLYYGTKGKAAEELRNALGYEAANLTEELVHAAFEHYLTRVLPSQDPDAYVIDSANAVLLDRTLNTVASYKKGVEDLYRAKVEDVDFAAQGPEIVREINGWVKDKTNGKIDKLFDDLDPSTIMVLLNAVYFKGTWKTEFEPKETVTQNFYNNGLESEAKEVPMMRLTEHFSYTASDYLKAEVLELPYKGENISMIILLPRDRDGLEAMEQSLTIEGLNSFRDRIVRTKVHLTLPRFKVEYSREMSLDFMFLGAKSIFLPGADFSGITPSKSVFVSQVLHKAVVEVDEKGSEAAAVTGIVSNRMKPIFEPPHFVVDHPFYFAIVDRRSDMVLFAGRVTNL